jgi:transcriptional regulator with XRE-family HTH domain
MDMQIDSKRVRAERERRAWSQDHLAEVSGLALRTIQRVESSGNGSYETVKALAAVFECDVEALRPAAADAPGKAPAPRARRYWAAGAAAAAIATFAFFSRTATAGQVLLDVALTVNEHTSGKHQLITAEGKDAEIRLEGQMRLIVTPSVNVDGSILLSIRLFEADGESFKLVSEPKVLALDNTAAVVNLTSAKGSVFGIAITPHRLAN